MMRELILMLALITVPVSYGHEVEADPDGGQSSGGGKDSETGGQFPNPRIDMNGFLKKAKAAASYREKRLLSEEQFIRLSQLPDTVILDARSAEKFEMLHVRGAISLSFPDIAVQSLKKLLPNKKTRILIYCNNNFVNDEDSFPSKDPDASLNLSTFISLYSYGYRNIYELGPLLDVERTRIPLVSDLRRR